MRKLYKYYLDCGRMGELCGLFVEDDAAVESCIGESFYMDDVLGKHSEIREKLTWDELTEITGDQSVIDILVDAQGSDTISGVNPVLNILEERKWG